MATIINVKTIPQPHGFTLNKLEFVVHFHGNMYFQLHDLPEHIPVQISVQVEDKWAGLLPVVHVNRTDDHVLNKHLTAAMFPFLPLPQGFEPTDACEWQQLAKDIEHDLLADPHLRNTYPECYLFMRELFWMAFVAAFPMFPHGDWPLWNSQIPMEGNFISLWVLQDLDDSDGQGCLSDTHVAIRESLWKQFSTSVEEMLSISTTH